LFQKFFGHGQTMIVAGDESQEKNWRYLVLQQPV
jgi:hypothetical protein